MTTKNQWIMRSGLVKATKNAWELSTVVVLGTFEKYCYYHAGAKESFSLEEMISDGINYNEDHGRAALWRRSHNQCRTTGTRVIGFSYDVVKYLHTFC